MGDGHDRFFKGFCCFVCTSGWRHFKRSVLGLRHWPSRKFMFFAFSLSKGSITMKSVGYDYCIQYKYRYIFLIIVFRVCFFLPLSFV